MNRVWLVSLLALFFLVLGAESAHAAIKSLKVDGEKVLIDGKPAKLWGLRVASAATKDEYTQELIESLEFYKSKGVNALVVFYQGSTGQTAKAFTTDGTGFADDGVRDRMRKIIAAANEKNMVVIVGLFFPRKMGSDSQDPKLASRDAYLAACKTAATDLREFKNVMICIAHEASKSNWASNPLKLAPEDAIACLQAIASVAPELPRGCGGLEHEYNVTVAASDAATIIFHNERSNKPPKFPQAKPAINVALFGRESGGRGIQGIWSPNEKEKFYEAIDFYMNSAKDHLCVHFQGWHEGGMDLMKNRFAPGGAGVLKDGGTAWFFESLDRKLNPPVVTRPDNKRPTSGKSIFD